MIYETFLLFYFLLNIVQTRVGLLTLRMRAGLYRHDINMEKFLFRPTGDYAATKIVPRNWEKTEYSRAITFPVHLARDWEIICSLPFSRGRSHERSIFKL